MRWREAAGGLAGVLVVVGVIAGMLGMLPWQGPGSYDADDAATDALESDPAAAVALGELLLTVVPPSTCLPSGEVDLGVLTETAAWVEVCRWGSERFGWILTVVAPGGSPTLAYGAPGDMNRCVQDLDGGWRSSHPPRAEARTRPCEDGYRFTGSG
jgi:hypothetical protein